MARADSRLALALQGMLAIGAAVLGASHVVAVDVDQDALDLAKENVAGIYDDDDDEPSPVRSQ